MHRFLFRASPRIVPQASLPSASSLRLYVRVGTACPVATANGFMTDGGAMDAIKGAAGGTTLYFLLTDAAGAADGGGAADYVYFVKQV